MSIQFNRVRKGDHVLIRAEVIDTDPGDEERMLCVVVGGEKTWIENDEVSAWMPKPAKQEPVNDA